MTMTQNPLFKPSPQGAELEKLVEDRKRALAARGELPPEPSRDPDLAAKETAAFMAEVAARFGFTPPLPGEAEAAMAARQAEYRAECRELEKSWRVAAWKAMAGEKFSQPWNWSKAPEEVRTPEARKQVQKVVDWKYGPRGLYIAGPSGRCKTRVLCRLLHRLLVDENRQVLFLDGTAFSNRMTRAFGEPESTERMLRELCTAPLLVVDDIAKRWTPATEEGAFTVIDRRCKACLPIIATSNYGSEDLLAMQQARGELAGIRDVSTPLVRRLGEDCEPIVL